LYAEATAKNLSKIRPGAPGESLQCPHACYVGVRLEKPSHPPSTPCSIWTHKYREVQSPGNTSDLCATTPQNMLSSKIPNRELKQENQGNLNSISLKKKY